VSFYIHRAVDLAVSSYDPDAQAFFNAIAAEGATLTTPQKDAVNNLVLDLKLYGVWSKMQAIYPIVGARGKTHKYNLKDPRDLDAAFRLKFYTDLTGSPVELSEGDAIHTSTGLAFNGTTNKYHAETFYTPNTSALLNDAHMSFYSRTTAGYAGDDISIIDSDSGGTSRIICRFIDDNIYSGMHGAGFNSVANTDGKGFYLVDRSASNIFKLRRNATLVINNAAASIALPQTSYVLGARKVKAASVVNVTSWSLHECAFATIGRSLTNTEQTDLNTLVTTYQTSLSRNV
jgi:hypothetical protein